MARRVRHYSDIENYYDYYREHGARPKTLCSREMTGNYIFTKRVEDVTCSRCKAKLEKLGMMAGQPNGEVLRITTASDVNSGDERTELYLQRLGVC